MRDRCDEVKGIYMPTTDDWYPCYPNQTVRMRSMKLTNGEYRICFWGADDFGMEYDTPDRKKHEAMLRRIPSVISIKELLEMGFVRS